MERQGYGVYSLIEYEGVVTKQLVSWFRCDGASNEDGSDGLKSGAEIVGVNHFVDKFLCKHYLTPSEVIVEPLTLDLPEDEVS